MDQQEIARNKQYWLFFQLRSYILLNNKQIWYLIIKLQVNEYDVLFFTQTTNEKVPEKMICTL